MTTLTAEAVEALRYAVADYRSIKCPIITDRSVYAQVDRALSRLAGGGRWDSRERAHVYDRDPRPELEALTGSTVIPAPCATRDKELSYWTTPPELAKELVHGLDLGPESRVLEPSAGDGALVRAVREAYPDTQITAVEPDQARRTVLRMNATEWWLHIWQGTFEDYADVASLRFDAVVMNPPFTLPGHRYAWAEHLVLAWDRLKPGGQLRAIVPTSLEYGRQRPIAAARNLITQAGGTWRKAGPGAFQSSGTGVHTLIVEATRGEVTGMGDTFTTSQEIEKEMDRNADSWPDRRQD